MKMKHNSPSLILIAGGAGYIGSLANKILNKRGYETVVDDNLSRSDGMFGKRAKPRGRRGESQQSHLQICFG
jgi:UDP-glucose 4-epimerase